MSHCHSQLKREMEKDMELTYEEQKRARKKDYDTVMDMVIEDIPVGNSTKVFVANATQVGGIHYTSMSIEPWEIIDANNLGFYEGNVLKYLLRYKSKNGIEDLKKARHYLDKLIEVQSVSIANPSC